MNCILKNPNTKTEIQLASANDTIKEHLKQARKEMPHAGATDPLYLRCPAIRGSCLEASGPLSEDVDTRSSGGGVSGQFSR